MVDGTKRQLLARAAKAVGIDLLAKRLNVPNGLVQAWIDGLASMPDRKLVELTHLLDQLNAP